MDGQLFLVRFFVNDSLNSAEPSQIIGFRSVSQGDIVAKPLTTASFLPIDELALPASDFAALEPLQ